MMEEGHFLSLLIIYGKQSKLITFKMYRPSLSPLSCLLSLHNSFIFASELNFSENCSFFAHPFLPSSNLITLCQRSSPPLTKLSSLMWLLFVTKGKERGLRLRATRTRCLRGEKECRPFACLISLTTLVKKILMRFYRLKPSSWTSVKVCSLFCIIWFCY